MENMGVMNKVSSIFLVGTLNLFVLIFLFRCEIKSFISTLDFSNLPAAIIAGGISLLAIPALLGALNQGFASAFIRSIVQANIYKSGFCAFFWQGRHKWEFDRWLHQFEKLVEGEAAEIEVLKEPEVPYESQLRKVCRWVKNKKIIRESILSFFGSETPGESGTPTGKSRYQGPHPIPISAAPLFFETTKEPNMGWVLRHYSTYYLATDICQVVLFCSILCLSLGLVAAQEISRSGTETRCKVVTTPLVASHAISPVKSVKANQTKEPRKLVDLLCSYEEKKFSRAVFPLWTIILLTFLSVYGLLALAVHRYLYTYNWVLRHCCMYLGFKEAFYVNNEIRLEE